MAGYLKLQFIKEIDGEDAINIRDSAFPAIFAAVEVSFPQAKTIGNNSFVACDALTRLDFPLVESIGSAAFKDCVAVEVAEFPELTELGNQGFMGLENMTQVSIPKVGEIGEEALSGCSSIVELDIPMATKMGANALEGCTSLQKIWAARLQEIGQTAFKGCTSLVEVTLPSLTELQPNLFEGCQGVEILDVPFATQVRRSAIDGCQNLKYINLQSASVLPDHVFQDMASLKCVNMKGSGILSRYQTRFGSWAYGIADTCDIVGMDGIYSKTEEGGSCFNWNETTITGLKSAHPTEIYDVFATGFNQNVFQNKADLTSIYLPRVQQILAQSFLNCTGLKRVEFPNATIVGQQAFTGCTNLKYICLSSMEKANVNPVNLGINTGCIVVCKDGVLANSANEWGDLNPRDIEQFEEKTYLTTEDGKTVELEWSGEITSDIVEEFIALNPVEIEVGTEVTQIATSTFSGFSELEKVLLPSTITEIGDYAFKDSGIREISIPDSVVSIGKGAFMNCRNLTHVDLPSGITEIKDQTFFGCTSLVGPIDIPSSVERIGEQAFMDCSELQPDPIIRIPVEVQSIGVDAFLGINNLILFRGRTLSEIRSMENYPWGIVKYDVQIRAGETEILRDIPDVSGTGGSSSVPSTPETPESVTPIVDSPVEMEVIPLYSRFDVVSSGRNSDIIGGRDQYELPDEDPSGGTVIRFGNGDVRTFSWTELTNAKMMSQDVAKNKPVAIFVGNNVSDISVSAFKGCTSLRRIHIPDHISTIKEFTFRGCKNLEEINTPTSLSSVGEQAFRDCRRLKSIFVPKGVAIGEQAFLGCNYLSDENGFVIVNNILFDYTGEDETVEIPHGVVEIQKNALFGTGVKVLIIPESVTTIKESAFLGCDGIAKYKFKGRTNAQVQAIANYPWGIANTDMLIDDGNCTVIHADYVNSENLSDSSEEDENEPQVIQVVCNCGSGSGGTGGTTPGTTPGGGTTDPTTTDPTTTDPTTTDPTTTDPSTTTPSVDPTPVVTKAAATASLADLTPSGNTRTIWTKWYTPTGIQLNGGLMHLKNGKQTVCTEYTTWNDSESYFLTSNPSKIYLKVRILPGRNMLGGDQTYIYPSGIPIYQQQNHSLWCWYLMLTGTAANRTLGIAQETGAQVSNPQNTPGVTQIYSTPDVSRIGYSTNPNDYQPTYYYINITDYGQRLDCSSAGAGWQNGFCFWALRYPIP